MAEFNPDEFLEEKEDDQFDPDSFLSEDSQSKEVGAGEAALRGAEQGLTFGFGDEIAGGFEALGQAVGLKGLGASNFSEFERQEPLGLDKEALLKVYRSRRDEARQAIESAEQAQPAAFTAGAVGGGFAVPGGAALKGADLLNKLKSAAKLGAGAGAIASAGTAEELEDVPEDALTGAAAGAVLGPLAPAALKGAQRLGRVTKDSISALGESLVGDPKAAFMQGLKGTPLVGTKAQRALEDQITEFGEELAPDVKGTTKRLSKLKSGILDRASERGQKVDIQDQVDEIQKNIDAIPELDETAISEKKRLQSLMDRFKDMYAADELSPREADTLRSTLRDLSSVGDKSLQSSKARSTASQGVTSVRDAIREELPITENVDQRISAVNRMLETLGIRDTSNLDERQIVQKFSDLISRKEKEGLTGAKARRVANQVIDDLKIANPRLADKITPRLNELAEQSDLASQASRDVSLLTPLTTARNVASKGGNIVGYSLNQLTPEILKDLSIKANRIGGPVATNFAEEIARAASKDDRGRNAVLFGVMQNPSYRELMREMQDEDELNGQTGF